MKKKGWIFVVVAALFFDFSLHTETLAYQPTPPSSSKIIVVIDPLKNRLHLVRDGKIVKTYPIAVGKPQTPSPAGDWIIVNKSKDWGKWFGTRWLGLNVPWGHYGIHGTNRPESIGWDVSHGCIRMHNRHIEELYELVPLGTKVIILGHVLGEPNMEPRRLAEGHIGADVMLVQNRLRAAGFFSGPCNGRFGKATEQAVKMFEKKSGLPVDGVVGLQDYIQLGLVE